MEKIEDLIISSEGFSPPDLDRVFDRLRFRSWLLTVEPSLSTMGFREEESETRIAVLENSQFSTTTKLTGEVVFGDRKLNI